MALESIEAIIRECILRVWNNLGWQQLQNNSDRVNLGHFLALYGARAGKVQASAEWPWNQLKPSSENVFWEFGTIWADSSSKTIWIGEIQVISRLYMVPEQAKLKLQLNGPGINYSHHQRMYSESLEKFGLTAAPKQFGSGKFRSFLGPLLW